MTPEAFNSVSEDVTDNELVVIMVNNTMSKVLFAQSVIRTEFICIDNRILSNKLLYDRHKSVCFCVFYSNGNYVAITLNHTEYCFLSLSRAPLSSFCLLTLMFVLLGTAEIHFITFYCARECFFITLHIQRADLLQHIPCSLLCHINIT